MLNSSSRTGSWLLHGEDGVAREMNARNELRMWAFLAQFKCLTNAPSADFDNYSSNQRSGCDEISP